MGHAALTGVAVKYLAPVRQRWWNEFIIEKFLMCGGKCCSDAFDRPSFGSPDQSRPLQERAEFCRQSRSRRQDVLPDMGPGRVTAHDHGSGRALSWPGWSPAPKTGESLSQLRQNCLCWFVLLLGNLISTTHIIQQLKRSDVILLLLSSLRISSQISAICS